MDLKEIVAISGMGGLFKVVAKRGDGLIVQGFDEDRAKFVPNRLHVFTPLDGITLYTNEDNIELSKVLLEMKKQEGKNAPVDSKASNDQHKDYFRKIVADFDEERVYVSDIKKVIKWFHLLNTHGLIVEEPAKADKPAKEEAAAEEATTKKSKGKEKEKAAPAEEKPKAKKAAKPKE